jgi:hypothetical protein
MLYGLASVVDYSTANSTLVDPIVVADRAEKAAALAAQQAQQAAAHSQGSFGGWAVILAGVAVAGWWYVKGRKHGE